MQNKTHNTFPSFDLSAREARLIYGVDKPIGQDVVAEKVEKVGNFVLGEYELKKGMNLRNEKGEKQGAKAAKSKLKIGALKKNILGDNRVWGKIERKDEWVALSGKNGKGKNAELIEKSDEKNKVVAKTKELEENLKQEVEVSSYKGRAEKCKDTRTESVTTIIRGIAGDHAEKITKVTVTKKNGKVVKLEQFINSGRRDELDYHIASTREHFKIAKGDIVTIGHDFLSANKQIDETTLKEVPIEHRQKEENVKKAISEVPADFGLTTNEDNEDLFEEIAKNNAGKEYLNETTISQDIVNMGIRKVCENFFVGEHGALLGLALSEKQKMPELFDKGELKQGALAKITKKLTAAAGEIKSTEESEIKADAKRFAKELGLFVGVPTLLHSAIALITGARLAVTGYFPLAYIDIGRGIRQGKVRILDRGGVKLLTDLSVVEGEIAARETQIGADGLTHESNEAYLKELQAEKIRLELIGLTRKKETIDQALASQDLEPKMRKKLESDQKILVREISSRRTKLPRELSRKEIEAYSSKSVNESRNKGYQELQIATNKLENKNGFIGDAESITKANDSIDENLAALESGFDIQQDKTEQLRVWYKRWFGRNIENPKDAVKELDEMIDNETNGTNGIGSRFKYRVGLWDNTDIVLNDVLGIEKNKTIELSDFKNIAGLMQDPAGAEIPPTGKQLKILESGNTKKILSKLKTYFTAYEAERGSGGSEFDHERDRGRLKTASEILGSAGSPQEKIIRLSVLASSQELQNISDRLVLKINIEDGMQIREAYQKLQSAIGDRADLIKFIEGEGLNKTLSKIYKNMEWIEQKVDLKNLDQNASLHAEINDTLGAPLKKIKSLSGMLSGLAKEGLNESEKDEIKNAINGLDLELAAAKTKVTELLGIKTIDARESHDEEDSESIENKSLRAANKEFSVPVTEAAFEDPKEISDFVSLVKEFASSMGSKEAFQKKIQESFPEYKLFKNSKGTETSNLQMITPEQVGGDEKLARNLNLLILNVKQEGKSIVDDFYGNSEIRSKMHLRNSEIAAAVGKAEWIDPGELKKYKGYIANTGRRNAEDLNHFIEGEHSGEDGDFGGAYKLSFERNVTLDGREFKIKYDMLARQKCFNAIFIPNGGIEEIIKPGVKPQKTFELESLTSTNIAAVQRQLFLLGIPLYFEIGGPDESSGYGSGNGGKISLPNGPVPQPPPNTAPPPFPTS